MVASARSMGVGATPGVDSVVSLGFVLKDSDPALLEQRCRELRAALPGSARVELLLVDDHTNPNRRELMEVVDRHGDSMRLVADLGGDRQELLDAVSQASGSELLVLGFGERPPWSALGPALAEMWADGADIATIDDGSIQGLRGGDGTGFGRWLAVILGIDGAGSQLGGDPSGVVHPRLVLARRWAVRWLIGGLERPSDGLSGFGIVDELAERADSLGLRTLTFDLNGAPAAGG